MASPSLERTSRTLPSLPPEDHQDHRLAQSPHSLAIQRRIRSSRKPRLAASNLPLANPQPGSLRRETASGHTGGMKGLSRMWRNSLVRFLGEGWRQRHPLTRPLRRGHRFGTILVDLPTRKVLDVLSDRTADTSAAWMAVHPEIELVSRDRGGDYAAAARRAVPGATETADRNSESRSYPRFADARAAKCASKERCVESGKTRGASDSIPTRGSPPRARLFTSCHR